MSTCQNTCDCIFCFWPPPPHWHLLQALSYFLPYLLSSCLTPHLHCNFTYLCSYLLLSVTYTQWRKGYLILCSTSKKHQSVFRSPAPQPGNLLHWELGVSVDDKSLFIPSWGRQPFVLKPTRRPNLYNKPNKLLYTNATVSLCGLWSTLSLHWVYTESGSVYAK